MAPYLFPAIFFLVSVVVSWLVGPVLHLGGTAALLLRIGILIMGTFTAFCVYWFWSRTTPKGAVAASHEDTSALSSLLRSAMQRLGSAQRGKAQSLNSLPLLYILGASNSGKTTVVLKSGMDPELLAGHVYQDDAIVPTRLANIWYAAGAVFVDAGDPLTRSTSHWNTLVRRTSLGTFSSLLRSHHPLRAAVVCISSESFFGADADEAVTALGRDTNTSLRQIARQLGADLPVHVILTKLDRIPGFAEYVQHLNHEEASERLGVSFSRENFSDGVYADRASALISSSLDELFFSLSEFRLEMLGRESNAANIPFIYQFPRELQKLRNNLTSYLVELARPSHLNANPYLCGLSCIGVRAQILEQTISAPAEMPRRSTDNPNATGIFSLREIQGSGISTQGNITRRIAQWCFLPHLFPQVFLAGNERQKPAIASRRIVLLRCAALSAASLLFVIWGIGLTVSYVNNVALEHNIRDAAAALPADAPAADFASSSQLASLERLRLALRQLEEFDSTGIPLRFRWGLYRGHSLIGPTRTLYFRRFRWLLLTSTQRNLRDSLNALPDTASADTDYIASYNPLRAYLIITAFHQYSSADFLAPVLQQYWLGGRRPQTDLQAGLAEKQFRFFGDELRLAPIYNISPSMSTVTHARAYLNSFGSFDRVYQNMLVAAARTSPPIDFNHLFPGSAATVVETHVVPGSFSRSGYAFMRNAIQHPDRYFTGEAWVLGDQTPLPTQGFTLSQKLAERYAADFSAQWQTYLRSGSVVRFRSLADAGQKLASLSGPNSALLALIFTASHNTSAASPSIARQFQPTHALVPPDLASRFIAPGNTTYINGLIGLQGAVSQFSLDTSAANNPSAAQAVISAAINAHTAVSQSAQAFNIDPSGHVEQMVIKLMQEPITSVEDSVRGAAPAQINLAGRAFCASFAPTLAKYPFDRNASVEATPAEVTSALKPGSGLLWQFYETNLKSLLLQQGSQWVASPSAPVKPTAQFLQFFNRLTALSNALFPNGAATPTLDVTAHIVRSPGIQSVTLELDAQRVSGADVSKQFIWSAQSGQQAQLIASYGTNNLPLQFSGNWSLFHLVDRGHVEQSSNPVRLAYPLEISGTPIAVNGIPLTERVEFSGPAASILVPGARSGLHCVPQIAH